MASEMATWEQEQRREAGEQIAELEAAAGVEREKLAEKKVRASGGMVVMLMMLMMMTIVKKHSDFG